MSLNLPQLRAFVAVVDAGGFGAAADELGISQSAVSHAVASLERALGGPLLVRAVPARPTVLGRRALPHARAALAAVGSLERITDDEALHGTVRLAATPTVRRGLLPDLLRHWRAELPGVTVRVFEGTAGSWPTGWRTGRRTPPSSSTRRPDRASSSPRTATAPCSPATTRWRTSPASPSRTSPTTRSWSRRTAARSGFGTSTTRSAPGSPPRGGYATSPRRSAWCRRGSA